MSTNILIAGSHPALAELILSLRGAREGLPFEETLKRISWFLAIEATRDLKIETRKFDTGLGLAEGGVIFDPIAIVPIVRAGEGMLQPFRQILPRANVWHFGAKRDETTLMPDVYLNKVPEHSNVKTIFVLDVMLATGGSAGAAIAALDHLNPERIVLVSVLAAPEGIRLITEKFPQVNVVVAKIDSHLNDQGFIVPGLGDAGDKLFPI